jgi:hypothetical protein
MDGDMLKIGTDGWGEQIYGEWMLANLSDGARIWTVVSD